VQFDRATSLIAVLRRRCFVSHASRHRLTAQLLTALLSIAAVADGLCAQEERAVVRVGFVADAPDARTDRLRAAMRRELVTLTQSDFDVQFPPSANFIGDGSVESVSAALARFTEASDLDLVVTLGFLGSQIAGDGAPWSTTVIAAVVVDAELQGLPLVEGTSGTTGFTYVTIPSPIVRDVRAFRELVHFDTIDFLTTVADVEVFDALSERIVEEIGRLGITARTVLVGRVADEALSRIPTDAEAIYVTPMQDMPPQEFQKLVDGINQRGIPSFAFMPEHVERGVMASLNVDYTPRLARRVAVLAHRIFLGDPAGTLPVNFTPGEDLTINVRTVRTIRVVPPLGLLLEARRLFEQDETISRQVTLQSAMEEAVAANLELAIQDQAVIAGSSDVKLATANLLPTINAGVEGSTISRSVAAVGNGRNPQHTIDGALVLQQLVFAEEAWAGTSIERSLQVSREQDRAATRLDVAFSAAEAYLQVLRAKALEDIQQANLELTRTSLQLAQVREQIGAAGPAERLRLESELAQRRAERIAVYADRFAAELALNQVINRPIDEQFATPETELEVRELIDRDFRTDYLEDLSRFSVFADFLVAEGLTVSPEIGFLDANIAAQDRLLRSRTLAFFLPTISLHAQVSINLLSAGAGSAIPGGSPTPEVTNFPWAAGVTATLPLFEGTARLGRRDQAAADLSLLEYQRDLAAQRIEQGVRTRLQFAQARLAAIDQTEAAAETARQSLELVTDAYTQGAVGVIDLLEAQNRALVAERGVANAVYDYLINVKLLEREVGWFEALATPGERADFQDRLTRAYENAGNR